jgi:pentatricopeptide repeat protein
MPPPPRPPQAQCTGPSQLRRALSLVADMRARGIALNTHTYSAILNVCIKAGQPELALDVYTQARVPRGACAARGRGTAAHSASFSGVVPGVGQGPSPAA